MEWVGDNLWLAWMALALVLIGVEAATVDFVFVMLGVGALFGALSAALGASFTIQIVVAAVTSLLLVSVVRPAVKRQFLNPEAARTIGSSALTGQRAQVLERVTDLDGRVRLAGETWSARVQRGAAACEPGQEVWVLAIEGATAIVTDEPLPDAPRT